MPCLASMLYGNSFFIVTKWFMFLKLDLKAVTENLAQLFFTPLKLSSKIFASTKSLQNVLSKSHVEHYKQFPIRKYLPTFQTEIKLKRVIIEAKYRAKLQQALLQFLLIVLPSFRPWPERMVSIMRRAFLKTCVYIFTWRDLIPQKRDSRGYRRVCMEF